MHISHVVATTIALGRTIQYANQYNLVHFNEEVELVATCAYGQRRNL